MAWWQNLSPFWQGLLVILTGVIGGVTLGLLVGYAIELIILKPKRCIVVHREVDVIKKEQPPDSTQYSDLLEGLLVKYRRESEALGMSFGETGSPSQKTDSEVVTIQTGPSKPKIVSELTKNLSIAIEPRTDTLQAFQTTVWDTDSDEVGSLPENIREGLRQAYIDMRLANNIVWLETEVGRRSKELDAGYLQLCSQIAGRLNQITSLFKEPDAGKLMK